MANDRNLIPLNKRTKSEQRGIAQKGGQASGVSRREKRSMKETLDYYLNSEVEADTTCKDLIAINLIRQSMEGNLKATDLAMKLTGDNIVRTDITTNGKDIVIEPLEVQVITDHAIVWKPDGTRRTAEEIDALFQKMKSQS